MSGFEWAAIGFSWWLAAGIVAGIARWFYRMGAGVVGVLKESLRGMMGAYAKGKAKTSMTLIQGKKDALKTQEEIEATASAWLADNRPGKDDVVVPLFRR
jgi:hypothetical protein